MCVTAFRRLIRASAEKSFSPGMVLTSSSQLTADWRPGTRYRLVQIRPFHCCSSLSALEQSLAPVVKSSFLLNDGSLEILIDDVHIVSLIILAGESGCLVNIDYHPWKPSEHEVQYFGYDRAYTMRCHWFQERMQSPKHTELSYLQYSQIAEDLRRTADRSAKPETRQRANLMCAFDE